MENSMMKKATFKSKFSFVGYQGIRTTVMTYEYRGCEYEVEDNPWLRWSQPLRQQHQDAQREIDEALDNPKPKKEHKYEDSAEYGFNKIWDYWETGEWKE